MSTAGEDGQVHFAEADMLSTEDLAAMQQQVRRRVRRCRPGHILARALPEGHGCIASRSLGESQRGIFEYFSGIVTERQENPAARNNCGLLLAQTREPVAQPPGQPWALIWDGSRPGDRHEHFWLYRTTPWEK
jgi:hypothetical protein